MAGYSLIEVIIYTSILAVIFAFSVGSILSVFNGFQKTMIESRVSRNGELALEKLVRDMRIASSTDTGSSIFGLHPGVLKLRTSGDYVEYSLSGTALQRKEGNNLPENITTSNVKATNLMFFRDFVSSTQINSEIVKVEFTLEAGEGKFFKSKKFFGSAVLRGAY